MQTKIERSDDMTSGAKANQESSESLQHAVTSTADKPISAGDKTGYAQSQRQFDALLTSSPRMQVASSVKDRFLTPPNRTGMPDKLKAGIESLSGLRMDHVTVHYNSTAPAQLSARAFAQGSNIYLGPGQERHLPHEAWHLVQQAQGRVQATAQMKGGGMLNDDPGLENEADRMGETAAALNAAPVDQGRSVAVMGSQAVAQRVIVDAAGTSLTEDAVAALKVRNDAASISPSVSSSSSEVASSIQEKPKPGDAKYKYKDENGELYPEEIARAFERFYRRVDDAHRDEKKYVVVGEIPPAFVEYVGDAEKASDQHAFEQVYQRIEGRYREFKQGEEVGFGGKPGLTGDIDDVTPTELIGVLRHIAANAERRKDAAMKSAISPLFDKLYLMENKEQGWNLRLHEFSPSEGAQGDEELPHYHRWTLASQILLGGYNNKNYDATDGEAGPANEQYFKYQLAASQTGDKRIMTPAGKARMRVDQETLFQQGDTRHFPIKRPHSVGDQSKHTGTTMTLAHTGKAVLDGSTAYEKVKVPEGGKPLGKATTDEQFRQSLFAKIAMLKMIVLVEKFKTYLRAQPELTLTPAERQHLTDAEAPNYLETSFLPALAIRNAQKETSQDKTIAEGDSEFGVETGKFLDKELAEINRFSADDLYEKNYGYIKKSRFSVKFSNWGDLRQHVDKPLSADSSNLQ